MRRLMLAVLLTVVLCGLVFASGGTGSTSNPTSDRSRVLVSKIYADTLSGYGDVVDLGDSNPYRSVIFYISVGVFPDSSHSGKFTFAFQDSSLGGTYGTVSASNLIGTIPILVDSADGSQVYSVEYLRHKRWVRPMWTVLGGPKVNEAAPFNVVAVKQNPKYSPVR